MTNPNLSEEQFKAPKGYCNVCGVTRELARTVPGQSVCKPCQQRLTSK